MSNISKFIFFILITIAVWLHVFIGWNYHTHHLEGMFLTLADLLGSSIGAYLLAWLIWKFVYKKKKEYLLGCFSIVFFLSTTNKSITTITELKQIHNAKKELIRINSQSTINDLSITNNQNEYVTYGKLSSIIKLVKDKTALDYKDWKKLGIEMLKIQDIMTPFNTLINPEKLKDAIKQTEIALNCLNEVENSILDRMHNFPKEIEKSNMERSLKKVVLQGFMENIKDGETICLKAFNAKRNELKEISNYYNFLLSKKYTYAVKDNFLIFAYEEDRIQNNQYMQNIDFYFNPSSPVSSIETAMKFCDSTLHLYLYDRFFLKN
jgi:hypothetical protein